MCRSWFLAAVVSAAILQAVSLPLSAEDDGERALGLWQSGQTYLELNLDGTFFRAEKNERDDVFGTFVVLGDEVHFSYSVDGDVLTMRKKLVFPAQHSKQMQLVDVQQQVTLYHRVRDF